MEVYHETVNRQENKFFDIAEKRFYIVPKLSRQNPYQQRRMANRLSQQLEAEGVDTYSRVHYEYWKIYRRSLHRREARHRTLAQPESVIVLSAIGEHALPDDPVKRNELLIEWIAAIPRGKKIGGTSDFGGAHRGFRSPPTEPGRYIMLDDEATPEYIKAILDNDEVEWREPSKDNIVITSMNQEEAEKYVWDRFVSVWHQLTQLSKRRCST